MNLQFGHWGAAEAFYSSFGHQPFQFWMLQSVFWIWLGWQFYLKPIRLRQDRNLQALVAFQLTSSLDAWLTANQVLGVGQLSALWAQWLSIAFVVIGDLRFFWFAVPQKPRLALALAFVTPVISVLMRAIPDFPTQNLRAVYLSYEIVFVCVLGVLLLGGHRWSILRGFTSTRTRRISALVFGYYALWTAADLLLLGGARGALSDAAWSARILANLLYYGGLLPWIAFNTFHKG